MSLSTDNDDWLGQASLPVLWLPFERRVTDMVDKHMGTFGAKAVHTPHACDGTLSLPIDRQCIGGAKEFLFWKIVFTVTALSP